MRHLLNRTLLASSVVLALGTQQAFATNGLVMEGYGPLSTGMGGAASALDIGTSGMANNPATLTMMEDGEQQVDVAIGNLRPDVSTSAGSASASSGGDSYLMPGPQAGQTKLRCGSFLTRRDGYRIRREYFSGRSSRG